MCTHSVFLLDVIEHVSFSKSFIILNMYPEGEQRTTQTELVPKVWACAERQGGAFRLRCNKWAGGPLDTAIATTIPHLEGSFGSLGTCSSLSISQNKSRSVSQMNLSASVNRPIGSNRFCAYLPEMLTFVGKQRSVRHRSTREMDGGGLCPSLALGLISEVCLSTSYCD